MQRSSSEEVAKFSMTAENTKIMNSNKITVKKSNRLSKLVAMENSRKR